VFDLEPSRSQTLADVGRIQPNMVVLPEHSLPLYGLGDARVFVGEGSTKIEWHHYQAPAAWNRDPPQLEHRSRIVGDVLEHV
jgi:hypothetical protein